MKEEHEVKVLEVDRKSVEQRLQELGFDRESETLLCFVHYDSPKNQVIRLRKEARGVVLCHKKTFLQDSARSSDETEVLVDDFDSARRFLSAIGLHETFYQEKTRIVWRMEDIEVVFDKFHGDLEHIPEFLEIEGPSVQVVLEFGRRLGFKDDQMLSWSGGEVREHYSK